MSGLRKPAFLLTYFHATGVSSILAVFKISAYMQHTFMLYYSQSTKTKGGPYEEKMVAKAYVNAYQF